jgi:hypothetical protein
MNKLTLKQIEEIRELFRQGKTIVELTNLFNLSRQNIKYWTNEEYRKERSHLGIKYYKNLSNERKKELYQKRKEYIKKYLKKRYAEDSEFRRKQIERSKRWRKSKIQR